jgi:protocatechuate 3,4-dioxygenase beta subunit
MREPALDYPGYKATALRHPKEPPVYLPDQITETTGRSASGSSSPAAC